MKNRVNVVMIVILVALLAPAAAFGAGQREAAETDSFELRLAVAPAPPHIWVQTAEYFKEAVEERSDGRVRVSIYHSGVLGNDSEVVDEIRIGSIDVTIAGSTPVMSYYQPMEILGIPYLFTERAHFERAVAADSPLIEHLKNSIEEADVGLKLLGITGGGLRNLSNRIGPVESIEDIQGMKVRVPPAPIQSRVWSRFGALPNVLPWGETYTGLQSGVVDAVESTMSGYNSAKLYEVAPYLALTGHQYMFSSIIMSQRAFERLPPDIQQIIMQTADEANELLLELGFQADEELIDVFVAQGVTVTEVDTSEFIRLMEPFQDETAQQLRAGEILRIVRDLR
ncbi:MAG: TRAP transporter substrate-binding protein [Spirochaetaceae bacterium]|nr:MAG: TRAP transporter substrate-binding protein [Spirochaetaceae bacterium]